MNEFEGKTIEELKKTKIGLESYKMGCMDTFQLIIDKMEKTIERTIKFYDDKIKKCNQEIIRRESE